MFSRCSQDVCRHFQNFFRMLQWVLWAWRNLMVISNQIMNFNDPKEFDDPRYSMIKRKYQLEEWTLIIQNSSVILPSPMIWLPFYQVPLFFLLDVSSAIVYILNQFFSSLQRRIEKCSFPSLIEYQCSQWHYKVFLFVLQMYSNGQNSDMLVCIQIYKHETSQT